MKYLLLSTAMLISVSLFSQNSTFERMLERSLEEKIKLNMDNPQAPWGKGTEQEIKSQKSSNIIVSDDASPESEVHAAINPNDSNNIVISPIGRTGVAGLYCPVYYTDDFGSSWNKSTFANMPSIPGNMSVGGGDPVLAYDDNNRVYLSWIDLSIKNMNLDNAYWGMYWAYSDDNGQSWVYDTTQIIDESHGSLNNMSNFDGPLTDKQWMAVDRNSTSAYYNNLYVSYVEIDIQTQMYRITVARKQADSSHFDTTKTYLTGSNFAMVQFGSISVGQNSRIHVSFFGSTDNVNYAIYHAYSDDGGQTFSAPVKVSDAQLPQYSSGQQSVSVDGIDDERLYPSVYNASSPNSNHVYITWTANGISQKDSDGLDIYFCRSTDGGQTFEAPYVINDDTSSTTHQFYSSINVAPTGRIDVSWYDRRSDSLNLNTDYYISSSYDYGQSFGVNARISGMSTDFSTVGDLNNGFGIGEYNMVLSTDNYIIPVWADGRNNDGDLDIYTAFVEKNSLSIEKLSSVNRSFNIAMLYPNPVGRELSCMIRSERPAEVTVRILDINGRQILRRNAVKLNSGESTIRLQLPELPAGMYFLAVQGEDGQQLLKFIRK